MQPLLKNNIKAFLERFDSFKGSEVRTCTPLSPTQIELTLTVQDSAKDFDWITLTLLFDGVSEAKLLEDSKLSFLDLSDGVSLFENSSLFYFSTEDKINFENCRNSNCYIMSNSVKYKQDQF